MNIYRLQSEEELELLQSRIKSRSKDIKVHESPLRADTGTELNAAPQVVESHEASELPAVAAPEAAPKASRTHQERAKASNKLKVASDKDYWAKTLQKQFLDGHLPHCQLEYHFHPTRKWRFDCTWHYPHCVVAEIEGAIWTQGRHTRGKGFLQDMEKYNEATRLGWRVFRFTPNQVKTRIALEYLKKVLG